MNTEKIKAALEAAQKTISYLIDSIENGDMCYHDIDGCQDYIGNAVEPIEIEDAGCISSLERINEALTELENDGWQPIETAPKDRKIYLYDPNRQRGYIGRWDEDKYSKRPRPYWRNNAGDEILYQRTFPPTHWRTLPNPPKNQNNGGE